MWGALPGCQGHDKGDRAYSTQEHDDRDQDLVERTQVRRDVERESYGANAEVTSNKAGKSSSPSETISARLLRRTSKEAKTESAFARYTGGRFGRYSHL
jgi:hypothetical protein